MGPEGGRGGGESPKIGFPCWCLSRNTLCTVGTPRNGEWVPAGCKDNSGYISVRLRAWTKNGACCVGASSNMRWYIHVISKAPRHSTVPPLHVAWCIRCTVAQKLIIRKSTIQRSSLQRIRALIRGEGYVDRAILPGFGLIVKSTGTFAVQTSPKTVRQSKPSARR